MSARTFHRIHVFLTRLVSAPEIEPRIRPIENPILKKLVDQRPGIIVHHDL